MGSAFWPVWCDHSPTGSLKVRVFLKECRIKGVITHESHLPDCFDSSCDIRLVRICGSISIVYHGISPQAAAGIARYILEV